MARETKQSNKMKRRGILHMVLKKEPFAISHTLFLCNLYWTVGFPFISVCDVFVLVPV
jgi:hypothetical protein